MYGILYENDFECNFREFEGFLPAWQFCVYLKYNLAYEKVMLFKRDSAVNYMLIHRF